MRENYAHTIYDSPELDQRFFLTSLLDPRSDVYILPSQWQ